MLWNMWTSKPHLKGYSIPLIMLIFVVVSHDRPSIFVLFFCYLYPMYSFNLLEVCNGQHTICSFSCVQLLLSGTCLFTSCRFITVQTSTLAFQIMNFPQPKRYIRFCLSGVCLLCLGYTQHQTDYHSLCYFVSKVGKCGRCWNIFDILSQGQKSL